MKHFAKIAISALTLSILAMGQLAHAEQFTRTEALQVLEVLMSAKKITNTYGGRYSTVIHDIRTTTVELNKVDSKFEIRLQSNAPAIAVDEILVDGKALTSLLQ